MESLRHSTQSDDATYTFANDFSVFAEHHDLTPDDMAAEIGRRIAILLGYNT